MAYRFYVCRAPGALLQPRLCVPEGRASVTRLTSRPVASPLPYGPATVTFLDTYDIRRLDLRQSAAYCTVNKNIMVTICDFQWIVPRSEIAE